MSNHFVARISWFGLDFGKTGAGSWGGEGGVWDTNIFVGRELFPSVEALEREVGSVGVFLEPVSVGCAPVLPEDTGEGFGRCSGGEEERLGGKGSGG